MSWSATHKSVSDEKEAMFMLMKQILEALKTSARDNTGHVFYFAEPNSPFVRIRIERVDDMEEVALLKSAQAETDDENL